MDKVPAALRGRLGIAIAQRAPLRAGQVAIGVAHNDQKDFLRVALADRGLGDVVVKTANKLQGLEFEVVFVWHPLTGLPEVDEFHIHRSGRNEPMQSKSEVIIADSLAAAGIEYAYELPLDGTDGHRRWPKFTIEDSASGTTYYWEHLGMLGNEQYRARWERKLAWYREQKILPREEGGGEK